MEATVSTSSLAPNSNPTGPETLEGGGQTHIPAGQPVRRRVIAPRGATITQPTPPTVVDLGEIGGPAPDQLQTALGNLGVPTREPVVLDPPVSQEAPQVRRRGRPPGSHNKPKEVAAAEVPGAANVEKVLGVDHSEEPKKPAGLPVGSVVDEAETTDLGDAQLRGLQTSGYIAVVPPVVPAKLPTQDELAMIGWVTMEAHKAGLSVPTLLQKLEAAVQAWYRHVGR